MTIRVKGMTLINGKLRKRERKTEDTGHRKKERSPVSLSFLVIS